MELITVGDSMALNLVNLVEVLFIYPHSFKCIEKDNIEGVATIGQHPLHFGIANVDCNDTMLSCGRCHVAL